LTVQKWMRALTLRQKVAQLVVAPFYGDNPSPRSRAGRHFDYLVRQLGVGGLIVINRTPEGVVRPADPVTMTTFLNRMQRIARLPLLVAGDFERGASMRMTDSTKFPHLMAFAAAGDIEATRFLGAETARQARALGIEWVLAPVADVNVNPENPVINIRSFGGDPASVAEHVTAFIEGARAENVLATAKHFPGHGDTAVDSHLELPKLDVSSDRLDRVELIPFRAAVAAGVDSIMAAHIAVPSLDPTGVPATVSRPILTDLLRHKLQFQGLIATDAMDMLGLSKQFPAGEAAVRAIEAGADVLFMPPKPDVAIRAIETAVRTGRLPRAKIDQSVKRVLSAKVRLGLDRQRTVDVRKISAAMATPEAEAQTKQVAERALTLIRGKLPIMGPACYIVLGGGDQGEEFARQLRMRSPESSIATGVVPPAGCQHAVIAAFASSSRTSAPVPPNFFESLPKRVILVALGNPSLIRDFPMADTVLATFTTVPAAESAAVKALFGEIQASGKSPVKIGP
jgi:beta-N-acetylhexosaminidase